MAYVDNIENRKMKRIKLSMMRVYFHIVTLEDGSPVAIALGSTNDYTGTYDSWLNIPLPEHLETIGLTAPQLRKLRNRIREGIKCPSCPDLILIDPACGRRCEGCCQAYC